MKNQGFTLIELIAVIAIIAILAVAAMPSVFSVTDEAHESTKKAVIGGIRSAITIYEAKQMASTGSVTYITDLDNANQGGLPCDSSNPCFDWILKDPIVDGSWSKEGTGLWQFRHLGEFYFYNNLTGTFQNVPPPGP